MLPTRTRNATPTRMFRDPWQMFRDFMEEEWQPQGLQGADQGLGHYPVNVHEEDDRFEIEAELPGFTEKDVNLTLENGVLTISAERQEEEKKSGQTHLYERRYNRVYRQFRLPNTVDDQHVDAQLKDGVLRLSLQKREEVKPRKIQIKGA